MYHIATAKVVIVDTYCIAISVLKHKIDDEILIESFMGMNINGSPYYLLLELCDNEKYKKYISVQKKAYKTMCETIEKLDLQKY